MAQNLDLEEQEQIDQIKHFLKQYGAAIAWLLALAAVAVLAWNGYRYWQEKQGAQASALYDEVDRAAAAGDMAKLQQAFNDIRDKYGATVPAQHAGLLAGKVFQEKGQADPAKAALGWVAEKSDDQGLRALARLRLASVLVEQKAYDEALKHLSAEFPQGFAALAADRKGDIYVLQGKNTEAVAAFTQAYQTMDLQLQYRNLIGAKLNSLGVDPEAVSGTTKAAG